VDRDDVFFGCPSRDSLDTFHRVSGLARFHGSLCLSPAISWRGWSLSLGLTLFERVLLLAGSNAGWLGAAIFIAAGVYQFTSFKDVCLRHCRSPMSLIA
jgi:predicted metal-binding membrane protein